MRHVVPGTVRVPFEEPTVAPPAVVDVIATVVRLSVAQHHGTMAVDIIINPDVAISVGRTPRVPHLLEATGDTLGWFAERAGRQSPGCVAPVRTPTPQQEDISQSASADPSPVEPVEGMSESGPAIGELLTPVGAIGRSHERQPDKSDVRPKEAVKHDPQSRRQCSNRGTNQAAL